MGFIPGTIHSSRTRGITMQPVRMGRLPTMLLKPESESNVSLLHRKRPNQLLFEPLAKFRI
jgi:hypothetical protein